jgi:Domain of unknown function (DUF4124)
MPPMNNLKTVTFAASRSTRRLRLAAVAMLLGGAAVGALAQYKIVGPDGKVTYTDKPPTAADIRVNSGTPAANNAGGGMPYETRQAMGKFPVTLYAGKGCALCDLTRDALRKRGVPYSEYSVNTNADILALQTRFNGTVLPVVVIGAQTLKASQPTDLQGYLDAAGYPAQARLTGYRWPQAVALAPPAAETPAPAPIADAPSAPASLLPPPSKSGIQF